MYHIKKDKRAYKSADLICDGLAKCLEVKKYNEISITDICDSIGVARSTFYRLFDTIEDILVYQYDSLFDKCIDNFVNEKNNISYARVLLEFLVNNKSIVTTIVKSGRLDILNYSTKRRELEIVDKIGLNINKKEFVYFTPLLNQLAFVILETWMNEGCKEDAEQLYKRLKRELQIIYKSI